VWSCHPRKSRMDHDFVVLAPLRSRINVNQTSLILAAVCEQGESLARNAQFTSAG